MGTWKGRMNDARKMFCLYLPMRPNLRLIAKSTQQQLQIKKVNINDCILEEEELYFNFLLERLFSFFMLFGAI